MEKDLVGAWNRTCSFLPCLTHILHLFSYYEKDPSNAMDCRMTLPSDSTFNSIEDAKVLIKASALEAKWPVRILRTNQRPYAERMDIGCSYPGCRCAFSVVRSLTPNQLIAGCTAEQPFLYGGAMTFQHNHAAIDSPSVLRQLLGKRAAHERAKRRSSPVAALEVKRQRRRLTVYERTQAPTSVSSPPSFSQIPRHEAPPLPHATLLQSLAGWNAGALKLLESLVELLNETSVHQRVVVLGRMVVEASAELERKQREADEDMEYPEASKRGGRSRRGTRGGRK